jgi:L-amino acid N-acyltransferase YncA
MSTAANAERRQAAAVEVVVPAAVRYQLLYRQERQAPFAVPARSDATFAWLDGPGELLAHRRAIRATLGWRGTLKALAKLCTATRRLYVLVQDGRVVHHGWATLGRCRHYRVEPDAAVVGPIWSSPAVRGSGLGRHALQQALDRLLERGWRTVYIDTSDDNLPCQKLIGHCGFGPPVGVYPRAPE